jgi:hypothetical protein
MQTEATKTLISAASDAVSILAIGAAALWFLTTTKFKPRIQFDLGCNFLPINENNDSLIAELQFIFENKGFVEHRLYNLNVSVHTLQSENDLSVKPVTKELLFKRQLLPRVSIVPKAYNFYFVRPGTRQVVTHITVVPKSISVIRVTASFDYGGSRRWPHTARRVFEVRVPHQAN